MRPVNPPTPEEQEYTNELCKVAIELPQELWERFKDAGWNENVCCTMVSSSLLFMALGTLNKNLIDGMADVNDNLARIAKTLEDMHS